MELTTLFEGIAYRHATDSNRSTAGYRVTDVIISPETGCENALFVAVKTGLANTRYQMELAFMRGCRLFLCDHDAAPGEGATVLITEEPERWLGVLAARVYGHPSREMSVIGITGSSGKSSVALLAAQVLRDAGYRVATLTSDGLSWKGKCTPPDAIVADAARIQRLLLQMKKAGAQVAILELSSYQLSHFAANGIDFCGLLLTNLAPYHIGAGEHRDFAEYRAAKEALMCLPAAFAILPTGVEMKVSAPALRFGAGGDFSAVGVCDFRPYRGTPGTSFTLLEKEEKTDITLPVWGDIAAENALCTFALCRAMGVSREQIAKTLAHTAVSGRTELLYGNGGRFIFRDNAFLPQDLARVLQALRPLATGRLAVLLGSVGGRAKARRAPLVRAAEQYADFLYLSADDPDFEDPLDICLSMQRAMSEPARAAVIPDRAAAIRRAVQELRAGDVLLITGKAYPHTQLTCGVEHPFEDAVVVKDALK